MKYLVVAKEVLTIIDELTLPIPLSHAMEEDEAKRFLEKRRFLDQTWRSAKIMPVCRFRALGGM